MRKACKINNLNLFIDEVCGDQVKVITADYNIYKELHMNFMPNGWYEKWVPSSAVQF